MDEMLFEPRMSRLVSLLLGAPAEPFQTIVGHKSSRQLEHSDSIHMSTYPLGYLAANWIAYEDAHPDAGPLVYYPGSHRLPYLLSEELGIPAETDYASYHRLYEPAVQDLIRTQGLSPRYFLPKKGDVLIWHANLLHGGSPVKDPKLTRKALVCHFFARGAVCYHDLTGTLTHRPAGAGSLQVEAGRSGEAGPHRPAQARRSGSRRLSASEEGAPSPASKLRGARRRRGLGLSSPASAAAGAGRACRKAGAWLAPPSESRSIGPRSAGHAQGRRPAAAPRPGDRDPGPWRSPRS
jgi:hypothetical protein